MFQNHILAGRPNGAAEDELRAKGFSPKTITAVLETEMKLNGLISPRESSERESITTQRPRADSLSTSHEEHDSMEGLIPVVLDQSSLPNTPDLSSAQAVFESPILGFAAQSPPLPNPQIQRIIDSEPIKTPPRQETVPNTGLERKNSISQMAKEAKDAIGRKMSLRSRRKNSKTHNGIEPQEWKLEDIPRRKSSIGPLEAPKSSIPEFLPPPDTAPVDSRPAVMLGYNPKSDKSASPPVSPGQFQMRNGSVSEGSTALTPTSLSFDGKSTPPTTVGTSLPSMSPPIPVRHPHHHSPKPSRSEPLHSPETSKTEPQNARKETPEKAPSTSTETTITHNPNESTSYISMDSSRPSSADSNQPNKLLPPSHLGISPQLPSLPSSTSLTFEDEISRVWLQHERERQPSQNSQSNQGHKRGQSSSSSQNGVFSKMSNSMRHARSMSADQKSSHSRRGSKAHVKHPSQPQNGPVEQTEEEKALLKRELRKSRDQITELQLKIQEDEMEKIIAAETRLENAREAYAGVETEREMVLAELKVLLKHKHRLEHGSKFAGAQETCDTILNNFEDALDKLKEQMRQQINEYTSVRAHLVEETGRLRALRDNYLEEAQQLNKKNVELADLNNDIQRNMDRTPQHLKSSSSGFNLFKAGHKARSPTATSISSVQSTFLKDEISHPLSFEPKKSCETPITDSPLSRISDTTIIMDEPGKAVVTRVTTEGSMDFPAPPKKFTWKMNTSALKKNAVKGFKSVWSGDTNVLVSSPVTISAPQLITSTSQGNGLNIVVSGSNDSGSTLDVYKTHSFNPKTFKRWQKCAQCGEKLTGTEIRCTGTSRNESS